MAAGRLRHPRPRRYHCPRLSHAARTRYRIHPRGLGREGHCRVNRGSAPEGLEHQVAPPGTAIRIGDGRGVAGAGGRPGLETTCRDSLGLPGKHNRIFQIEGPRGEAGRHSEHYLHVGDHGTTQRSDPDARQHRLQYPGLPEPFPAEGSRRRGDVHPAAQPRPRADARLRLSVGRRDDRLPGKF